MTKTKTVYMSQLPAWTQANWSEDGSKLLNDADPFKWSGETQQPPAIGATVHCYLASRDFGNNEPWVELGDGVVTQYFVDGNWLGVVLDLKNPPQWWLERSKGKNEPAHVFGLDLDPTER